MKKRYINLFLIMFATLLLMNFVSANLGTFKQGDCVPIIVPLNASTVTLTNVNSPPPVPQILLTNQAMTKTGMLFNYTFCNTNSIGSYSYGYCDDAGSCYGNTFDINSGGLPNTTGFYFVIILIIALIITLGLYTEELWILILGGIFMIILGLYCFINGIIGLTDPMLNVFISSMIMVVGFYISIKSSLDLINDKGGVE